MAFASPAAVVEPEGFFVATDPYCFQVLQSKIEELAANYAELGTALGVPQSKLEAISLNVEAPTVLQQFKAMIIWWRQNPSQENKRKNTWKFLAKGIRRCGNNALAEKVEHHEQYLADKEQEVELDLNDLLELLNEIAHEWYTLGTNLRVDIAQLEKIDRSLSATVCLSRTLQEWIKLRGRQATLPALVQAIKSPLVGNRKLAIEIERDKKMKKVLKIGIPAAGQKYVCKTFYCKMAANRWIASLVIIKNHEDLVKTVEESEEYRDAERGDPMSIVFLQKKIVFSLPENTPSGWDIHLHPRHEVFKSDVDEFNGVGVPPCCDVRIQLKKPTSCLEFEIEVTLKDAEPPKNEVILRRKAEMVQTSHGTGQQIAPLRA